jgi:hypothetical protein
MRGPVQKVCERCQQAFECGQYGCWCGKVGVTEQQMDWISARFEDCLCPDCLSRVTRGETGSFGPSLIP